MWPHIIINAYATGKRGHAQHAIDLVEDLARSRVGCSIPVGTVALAVPVPWYTPGTAPARVYRRSAALKHVQFYIVLRARPRRAGPRAGDDPIHPAWLLVGARGQSVAAAEWACHIRARRKSVPPGTARQAPRS